MSYTDHDHRGDYADQRHDHDGDYAEKHHRHYDLEREDERLQGGLREVMAQVDMLRREYEEQLRQAFDRIRQLEQDTPQARQLQLEADLAAADLAESGYDRELSLGPGADDEGEDMEGEHIVHHVRDPKGDEAAHG